MIFDSIGEINPQILIRWKYYGLCKDSEGKRYAFYTNSYKHYFKFKNKKEQYGMKALWIKVNEHYLEILKKLKTPRGELV